MFKEIEHCRISKSTDLTPILNLGNQCLSGVFPESLDQQIEKGPLELVWCKDSQLVQLKHTFSLNQMYGNNYGYRSSLNNSMVKHLNQKIDKLKKLVSFNDNDLVIDIGSNDATTLKAYKMGNIIRVGIDPTGEKFKRFYDQDINLICDFFPTPKLNQQFPLKKAKIITSIAMFYDLEDPTLFVQSISEILHHDGIWHFEQSYLPLMLKNNSYDTICHEHLEYYTIGSILPILQKYKLKIIDIELNEINGGSFAVTVVNEQCNKYNSNEKLLRNLIAHEESLGLETLKPFKQFKKRVLAHKKNLKELICNLKLDGKKIFGYGASTKGNIILQFCELSVEEIPYIAEINEDKFGHYTPGSNIPIISQAEANKMLPDYYLVLPWHFKNSILINEIEYRKKGGKFIFPLPDIEII